MTAELGGVEAPAATFYGRLIGLGDIHGTFDGMILDLLHAGLVDRDLQWCGGRTTLVQTGDVIDRGPDSLRCWRLLQKLQQQAPDSGGVVRRLLGNHELMPLQGQMSFLMRCAPDIVDYGVDLFLDEVRGEIVSGAVTGAFRFGNRLFVHGGLRTFVRKSLGGPRPASMTAPGAALLHIEAEINRLLCEAVLSGDFSHPIFWVDPARGGDQPVGGVFWTDYETLCHSREARYVPQVVGHSPEGLPGSRVRHTESGRFINIDVGHARVYGGNRGYLEIVGDDARHHWLDKTEGPEPVWKTSSVPNSF